MQHDLDTFCRSSNEARIADVAEADVHGGARRRVRLVEPTGRSARVVETERADVGTLRDKALGEVAADESVRARDEDLRATQGHVAIPRAAASCSRWPTSIHSASISNAPTDAPSARSSAMRSGVSIRRPGRTRATTDGSSA